MWLEHFPDDFKKGANSELLKQIQTFAVNEVKENCGIELLKKIQQILEVVSNSADTAGKCIYVRLLACSDCVQNENGMTYGLEEV